LTPHVFTRENPRMNPLISFNDGRQLPTLGLGLWRVPDAQTAALVRAAVDVGYRYFDTAWVYFNERGTGEGLRTAALPREELFVSSKLWNKHQGYDSTLQIFDESLKVMGLEYLDLYLIHWAAPAHERFVDTWRAFVRLRDEGRVRSIGVCNFHAPQLARLIGESGVTPVLNQLELHPLMQQRAMREVNRQHGIVTQSWSPLGQGKLVAHAGLEALARKHARTIPQIILRWHVQSGLAVLPKTANPSRLAGNLAVFDFELDAEDMQVIAALDEGFRIGPDPDSYSQL
jgi:2,5-diketo-D-gluconate reductase A